MASAKKAIKTAKTGKAKTKSATKTGGAKATNGASRRTPPTSRRGSPDAASADPALFSPLTPGEIADALRTLTEDRRLGSMAKVGRYRVICTEPLVVKPPHWMAGHRLARVVVYDYSADRCVDGCVDLDAGVVAHLELTKGQPMLSREEEALAISVAMADERIRSQLQIGDEPQTVMHYWGRTPTDMAYTRRSASIIFGRRDGHSTLVAIVDLLDNQVTGVVPAESW